MVQVYLFLFLGLLLLLASGKYLVDSSVALARRLRIPTMIIGLTVVAMGTSSPELLVSLQAAIHGYPEIAVGNVVGSNIANILLILGITALIYPIPVPKKSVRQEWPIMMGVSLLLFGFSLNGSLSRWEGMVFILLLILYIGYAIVQTRREKGEPDSEEPGPKMKAWVAGVVFMVSCAGLAYGADLFVRNAAAVAESIGISQRLISITMVAVGTSIPELTTSVAAAIKKETDIAIGNIIGSNILNIVAVLGVTGIIKRINIDRAFVRFDIPWMVGVGLLLLLMMVPSIRSRITRWEGALMIGVYLLYVYLIF